jgi:hypothetical protein
MGWESEWEEGSIVSLVFTIVFSFAHFLSSSSNLSSLYPLSPLTQLTHPLPSSLPLLLGEAWANIGAIHMHERSFDKALHALQEGKKHKPRYTSIT